ncbi:hypothetical protein Pla108_05960 [Botrimarina colliarenosi]|uniref:SHOCT domain-containing protein n=1 Tax=Botrimarina colliarenosi TaxID=2528001 RepID=A0A5C6ANA6_9BACT|nr:SHOCT domain-containing protein [Botrimarina colliarenosi]TWT99653.1 hypothetical protein Pla108_05960 [Botrimarina colliarenosi]
MSIPPLAAATFWIALILGITAGFFVVVRKWAKRRQRSYARSANDLMAEFRELHARGELTDTEFQRIREKLAPALTYELHRPGEAANVTEAAEVLKQTARTLLAGWSGTEGERDTNDAAGGAAQEGCDAKPPIGGDSTKESR